MFPRARARALLRSWPVLCLFALTHIRAGEELTYDYNYVNERAALDPGAEEPELALMADERERTRCTCGARSCRKWLFGAGPRSRAEPM